MRKFMSRYAHWALPFVAPIILAASFRCAVWVAGPPYTETLSLVLVLLSLFIGLALGAAGAVAITLHQAFEGDGQ